MSIDTTKEATTSGDIRNIIFRLPRSFVIHRGKKPCKYYAKIFFGKKEYSKENGDMPRFDTVHYTIDVGQDFVFKAAAYSGGIHRYSFTMKRDSSLKEGLSKLEDYVNLVNLRGREEINEGLMRRRLSNTDSLDGELYEILF